MSQPDERSAALWSALAERWPENRIAPTRARIAALVELLGDPQRAYPVIHVAGTNGKTSTARMIESVLRAAGLRTGLFTSPHLVDPSERIQLEGRPIDPDRLLQTWEEIAPYAQVVDANSVASGDVPLSFFEIATALAFAAFADAPVDVAIIEVGMGGTWDATNVADGSVCVITPIGMDHVDYLGDTLELIAAEKAGIIGPDVPVVIARQEPEALAVVLARCAEQGATPLVEDADFALVARDVAVGGQVLTVRGLRGVIDQLFVPLFGEHQAHNATVALAAVEAFLSGVAALDHDLLREGLAGATSPGRLQVLRRSPTILADVAHNPHGAHALAASLTDSFTFASLVGVLGVLADKDAAGIVEALAPVLTDVVVTEPRSPRALPADELAVIVREVLGDDRVSVVPDLAEALDAAAAVAEGRADYGTAGVLVTGSVVLVGEAMMLLGVDPTAQQGSGS